MVMIVVAMACVVLGHPRVASAVEEIESDDPSVHLNFASILFYKGRRLVQAGDAAAGGVVFKVVEHELQLAMQLAEQDPNERRRQLLNSQCAYLLGEVNFFVFHDREKAKAFYQDALRYFPEHEGASEALKRFEPSPLTTP